LFNFERLDMWCAWIGHLSEKLLAFWIFSELPLLNFERLDMWRAWIGPPCERFWKFEFLESSCCSISSVSICDAPESDIRVKIYDHLNFFIAFVVQFWASRYVMRLNRTSELKVMTFEYLESFRSSISSVSIYYAPESDLCVKSYDHLNISRASIVQFWASRYVMLLNRTSKCKVMTLLISRELPFFNFEHRDILSAWIGYPTEKLWPFEFLESFRCSISSVSICDAPELDIRVKSYFHFNFFRASVVQFRASPYVMRLNWTSVWKVLTIWISRELLLFNFRRVDMWCTWIAHPSEKLWPFQCHENFHCSISSISIY